MKKFKFKKVLLVSIGSILSILVIYGITFYCNFFQGWVNVENNKLVGNAINYNTLKQYKDIGFKASTNFNDEGINKITNVTISFLGKNIPKDIEVINKAQRYYLPLDFVTKTLGYNLKSSNPYTFEKNDIIIKFSTNDECTINNKPYKLRGDLINYENKTFISISDIEYIFSLTAVFDFDKNSISLLNSKLNKNINNSNNIKNGRAALIRLEDFTAGGSLIQADNQAKFKAMGDYLYSNNIRFNVAWVPRYINPKENIDNDLLSNNNLSNVGFINLLDYLLNSGGEIGLHGYTHQSGDSISTVGSELTKDINATEEETRAVVEKGITTASALNIPVKFFESPHYHATKKQKEIIGEYFQILYEPYSLLYYTGIKTTDNGNLYVPTPLDYVKNRDASSMIEDLKDPSPYQFASLFYHPTLELEYLNFNTDNNTFSYTESKDSILKSLVDALNNNGYSTLNVSEMCN